MGNKIKFLIIPLVITFLFVPNFASADIFGIMDLFESQLSAIEEFTGVPMNAWVITFILYLIGLIAFTASASLLTWVLKLPLENPGFISLSNDFVTQGWTFISGLVNISIILILLIIAFAYILKIETFKAKQTFVNLIIIALLVNFSLVFVKALFDVSNILYNYILTMVGGDFVWESFKTFAGGLSGMIAAIGGSIIVLTAPLMIPPAAPWAQLGVLVVWLTGGLFFIPTWIFQLVIAFLFSFIFITLFFLFSARIFIIWILAVFSPLAFLCWVLPQTKKHWDEWLKYLLEWTFLGIFVLFLLALGLKTIPSLEIPTIRIGLIPIPSWFIYYFFLFIYLLIVIFWLLQKTMPEFAKFLIDQSKALGGIIWTKGLKPMTGMALKGAERATALQAERERAAKSAGRDLTFREKLGGIIAKPTRWGYRAAGVSPEFIAAKRVEKETEKFEKAYGNDTDTAVAAHLGIPVVSTEMKSALGLYLAREKGAKGIGKLNSEEQRETVEAISRVDPMKLEDVVKHMPELADETTSSQRAKEEAEKRKIANPKEIEKIANENKRIANLIQKTMVSKGLDDEDVQKLIKIGISGADAIRKAAFKKAVDAMKVADIDNLGIKTIENDDFREMAVRFKDTNFIRRIGEEKGAEYVEMLHGSAEYLGAKEIARTNSTLLRSSITNPGFRAIFPPIKDAETSEQLNKLLEEIKEEKNIPKKEEEKKTKEEGIKEEFTGGIGPT